MSSDNPTVASANESTGVEPLNTSPTEPVPLKQDVDPANDVPPTLTDLPAGCEPVVFPLDLGSRTKNNQTVSSLPSAREFEDLVKAKIRPPGPARAEEVPMESAKSEYKEVLDKVGVAIGTDEVKVYKLETGMGKGEVYVVGLDVDGERIVGVRIP
ncbi:uncharacterized protein LTR77_002917 [Saxophila tyrrhenica]|uniref:Uncharacterized protein n=1 Tax=Saxophila tyrrhenica TaxID=1690608 RepID=A0AAV9PGG1_9PEZI|nr:hypothetical protein LTR77_002917 [Saxophila tyrrhenica]